MKIKINQNRLDLDKLINNINLFEKRGGDPSYLVMNKDTVNELISSYDNYIYGVHNTDSYMIFYGIPIALCERLKFGEVDII